MLNTLLLITLTSTCPLTAPAPEADVPGTVRLEVHRTSVAPVRPSVEPRGTSLRANTAIKAEVCLACLGR